MIYSNDRKLALSGWLQQNDIESYNSSLRLQKYLFFYEAFCKTSATECDFERLKGWRQGPVFSTVWGDYTKDRKEFNKESVRQYERNASFIHDEFARRSSFLVRSMSENELSDFTHKYHIWRVKADRIMAGELQVELEESDFSDDDRKITVGISTIFPDNMIQNASILLYGEKCFIISNDDLSRFTERQADILWQLSRQGELTNPVFVQIEESGVITIDQ